MVKCELDEGKGIARIEVKGNAIVVLADLQYVIHDVYRNIHLQNPLIALAFKELMQNVIADDSSAVWRLDRNGGSGGIKSVSVHLPENFPGKEE